MINLASDYSSLGRLTDAMNLREEALQQLQSSIGGIHPDTLVAMQNLINSFVETKSPLKELEQREELLLLSAQSLGEGHPDTKSWGRQLLLRCDTLAESEFESRATLKILDWKLPDTDEAMLLWGQILKTSMKHHHYTFAERAFQNVISIRQSSEGLTHESIVISYGNFCEGLYSLRETTALKLAEKVLRSCLSTAERADGITVAQICHLKIELGRTLALQHQWRGASEEFVWSIQYASDNAVLNRAYLVRWLCELKLIRRTFLELGNTETLDASTIEDDAVLSVQELLGGEPPAMISQIKCWHKRSAFAIQCPECRKWHGCRHCHNLHPEYHELDVGQVERMLCLVCGREQEAGST